MTEMDKYQISAINDVVVMAYRICEEVHFKAFPIMLLISENWYVEQEAERQKMPDREA